MRRPLLLLTAAAALSACGQSGDLYLPEPAPAPAAAEPAAPAASPDPAPADDEKDETR